jgi:hypothetical protein
MNENNIISKYYAQNYMPLFLLLLEHGHIDRFLKIYS